MKLAITFFVGLACGWLLLWQVQDVANTLENECTMQQAKTGYNCKQEIRFSELVYNVK